VILKNNKVGEFSLSDIKIFHKVTVIVMVWYWHKDR
jgi:hypothetical protein